MSRFVFRLATLLGTTPAALRDSLTPAELAAWAAYMEATK
jgi:hypothetical protein